MRKKLALLAMFGAINLVLSASHLYAGWTDKTCRERDGTVIACCPDCSWFCKCTL